MSEKLTRRNALKTVAGAGLAVGSISSATAATATPKKFKGITYDPVKSLNIGGAFASLAETDNELRGQLQVDGHSVPLNEKNPNVREVEFGTEHRIYHFDDRSGYGGRILVTDGAATGYVVPSEERRFPEQPGTKVNPADERVTFNTYSGKKAFKIVENSISNPVERARNSATGGSKDD